MITYLQQTDKIIEFAYNSPNKPNKDVIIIILLFIALWTTHQIGIAQGKMFNHLMPLFLNWLYVGVIILVLP